MSSASCVYGVDRILGWSSSRFLSLVSNTNLGTAVKGFCRWTESPKSVELVIWR